METGDQLPASRTEMVSRRVVVTGRVQGVFFRDTLAREARRRRVSGWVRNNRDGSVEAVFRGERGQVGEMISLCRSGPPAARVDSVTITTAEPVALPGFEIHW